MKKMLYICTRLIIKIRLTTKVKDKTTMKKLLLCAAMMLCVGSMSAQLLRSEELEKYAKERYGDKWADAAANLGKDLVLDKNKSLSYTQIIPCEGKTKEQLYVMVNYWVNVTFNDANSVIQLNDKESGTIICQGSMKNIALHESLFKVFEVSIKPIIKIDIKDGKIRVTYTVQSYDVDITMTTGTNTPPLLSSEKWTVDSCYPFVEKDSHKKTSSKALIMTHAYSNVVMDKIEEAVKNGIAGNEDDDW